jgi:DAK2 domain fusion protein YloV
MTLSTYQRLVSGAAGALKERKDEVNRLNVFPVPDGDTGTNMSLTMDVVVAEVAKLPSDADLATTCRAVTHGSLMGARGNSGVILSQILRGVCEGLDGSTDLTAEVLASALQRSVTVAFQAVRKPVEGTILTVLRDTANAASAAASEGLSASEALETVRDAAFESVKRTPELLPVLKENGVVDAGGYGLAVLIEGFTASALGHEVVIADVSSAAAPLRVVPVDDWDDSEYLYCTEFLLFGREISADDIHDFVASIGGSELVVGSNGEFKVHVHTNDPGAVLSKMTAIGEVAEVHINNMRIQTEARDAILAAESAPPDTSPLKPIGFVAVVAGEGLSEILTSLGVDRIVTGGQTMNPSTADIAEAINSVRAEQVVVLPNNRNIIMAAGAAATLATKPVAVVPTTSVPQAFASMLSWDGGSDLDAVVADMTEAAGNVRTGEITTAVKDAKGKVGRIRCGQVIGIIDHEIEVVGDDVTEVALDLANVLLVDDEETLTVLAGEGYSDDQLAGLAALLGEAHDDVDIETHRGGQPLYPIIMSAE